MYKFYPDHVNPRQGTLWAVIFVATHIMPMEPLSVQTQHIPREHIFHGFIFHYL